MSLNKNSVVSGGELLQKDLVEKTSDTVCGIKDNVSNTLEDLSSGIISFAHGVKEKLSAYVGKDAPLSSEGINERKNIQETSSIAEKLQGTIDKLKLPFKVVLIGSMAMVLSGCLGKNIPRTDQELAVAKQQCESQDGFGVFNYVSSGGECVATRVVEGGENAIVFFYGSKPKNKRINPFINDGWIDFCQNIGKNTGKTSIIVSLPGFRFSSKNNYGNGDRTLRIDDSALGDPEYYEMIKDIITELKTEYNLDEIDLFGYSMGGVLSTVLAGKYGEELNISNVATFASPLKYDEWLDYHDYTTKVNTLEPTSYIDGIIKDRTSFFLVSGEEDSNVRPKFSQGYDDLLSKNNIESSHLVIEGVGHDIFHSPKLANLEEEVTKFLGRDVVISDIKSTDELQEIIPTVTDSQKIDELQETNPAITDQKDIIEKIKKESQDVSQILKEEKPIIAQN